MIAFPEAYPKRRSAAQLINAALNVKTHNHPSATYFCSSLQIKQVQCSADSILFAENVSFSRGQDDGHRENYYGSIGE